MESFLLILDYLIGVMMTPQVFVEVNLTVKITQHCVVKLTEHS